MDTHDARMAYGDDAGDQSKRATLQLELRVRDRQVLATFRDAFLRWLNDRSGPFARAVGVSDNLSLEELPSTHDPHGLSTLRVTVRWSMTPAQGARAALPSLPSTGEPPHVVGALASVDRFVFFPDPPDAAVPIYRDLSAPLHAAGFQPPKGAPQLRLAAPVTTMMARNLMRAVQSFLRGWRGLANAGLTIRFPMAAGHPRAWTVGLIGVGAITAGFAAGSIYLAATDRPLSEPTPVSVAAVPSEPAAMSPLVMALPSVDLSGDAYLRRATRVIDAPDPAARPPRPEPATASSSTPLADTEVTTASSPDESVARPALLRRPSVMVVRAMEMEGASASTSAADRRRVKGTLLVKSEPQGAEVSINGVLHGRTPLMIRGLGAGSRVLRLDLAGYDRWSWAVAVVGNKNTPVTVKLQPREH